MALTNLIEKQEIIDEFKAYVQTAANSGITWGTNSIPTYSWPTETRANDHGRVFTVPGGSLELVASSVFAGETTTGRTSTASISGDVINATTLVTALINDTRAFTAIRNIRVKLTIQASGAEPYNAGTKIDGGVVYDVTAKAYLTNAYSRDPGVNGATYSIARDQVVTASNLEDFFDALKTRYNTLVAENIPLFEVTTCHANCHNNCHTARSRR